MGLVFRYVILNSGLGVHYLAICIVLSIICKTNGIQHLRNILSVT